MPHMAATTPAPKKPAAAKKPGAAQRRRVSALEKRKQALELRLAGATYQQIADRVGYTDRSAAFRACKEEIDAIPREAASEVRSLELDRLDHMWLRAWTRLQQNDLSVIDKLLRIHDARARLTGLHSIPEQVGSSDEVKGMFAGMLASAQAFAAGHSIVGDVVTPVAPQTPEPAPKATRAPAKPRSTGTRASTAARKPATPRTTTAKRPAKPKETP